MKWFDRSKLHTIAELKSAYKELLKIHHPDNGGQVSDMQEINAEYDTLFSILSKKNEPDGESTTQDNKAKNEAFKAVLNQIIGYSMEIELIGCLIWCFNCCAYKDRLKELGFKFAPKKKAWTWHFGDYSRYHRGETPIDDIRAKYGSQKVTGQYKQQYSLD
ncbi:MAG: J domain-containing protein [Roseburia sp.]|nr:J domain-containing protein [Roseburia sp.]